MKKPNQPPGRPADRRKHIVRELRHQIVSGQLLPGRQLPPRVDVEQQFSASPLTVQSALDQLKRDGFVETRGRLGTFVAANPPHLTTYPVIFPCDPKALNWVRHWTALCNEAIGLQQQSGLQLPFYYGVDGHEDGEDYQRLLREVRAHRVAGLIFASSPFQLQNTPLMTEPDIPRVAVMTPTPALPMPSVVHDRQAFFPKALDYLAARGRQRIAILSPPHITEQLAPVIEDIERRNMTTRPYWVQGVHLAAPQLARNCAHLLMHEGQSERPDALIISDDNLVEFATAGLIAAGVRVPDDLEVVAHCNFPWPTPSVVPVKRLGYEVSRVLQACLDSINQQRQGNKSPDSIIIPAVFEEEVTAQITLAEDHSSF